MTNISLFITRSETVDIVRALANRYHLGGFKSKPSVYEPFDPVQNAELVHLANVSHVYLVPESDASLTTIPQSDVRPRFQGWIRVILGREDTCGQNNVLEMTQLDSEDHASLSFRPSRWLRQFKKEQIREGKLKFGVKGMGLDDTNKGRIYKGIGYSQSGLDLYVAGYKWMQRRSYRSYFTPLD